MKRIVYILLLIAIGFIFLSGCSSTQKNQASENSPKEKQSGYTVKDARGKEIVFEKKPQRIVSGFVFADEVVLALVDHSRIAGMDKWVHDEELSSASKEAEDVKTVIEMNTESIAAVHPDLVLMPNTMRPELLDALEDMKIRVYVYQNARLLKDIPDMITSIAAAVGETERGKEMIKEFRKDLETVKNMKKPGNPKEKALLFLRFGAIGGEGTIYHDVLATMGFYDCYNEVRKVSAVARNTSSILSKEEVVKANPDLFLMALWTQGQAYKDSYAQLQEIYEDPAYATVNAVKNKRAYIFPQRYINSLSHHAGKNMIELAKLLEPRN